LPKRSPNFLAEFVEYRKQNISVTNMALHE